jgi:hypothetical protein
VCIIERVFWIVFSYLTFIKVFLGCLFVVVVALVWAARDISLLVCVSYFIFVFRYRSGIVRITIYIELHFILVFMIFERELITFK